MALPSISKTLDNLNSSTLLEQYATTVTDNIFSANPVFNLMLKHGKSYDGGQIITEPILYGEMTAEIYSGAQILNPNDEEILTTAQFKPMNIEVPVMLTDTDDLENRGRSAIIDLMEVKFTAAQKSIEKALSTEMWTAAASQTVKPFDLWGIPDFIPIDPTANPAAGSFGGISRIAGQNIWWRNQFSDLSGTFTDGSVTFKELQHVKGEIVLACGEKPDVIVTTQAIFDRLWGIADSRQQLGSTYLKDTIGVGFDNIDFSGIPIIVDPKCPDHYVYFINTKRAFLKYHKDAKFVWTPWLRGTRQLMAVKYLKFTGQIVVNEPRALGAMLLA